MLEPRRSPEVWAPQPVLPASSGVAVQTSGEPTRKVAAATNVGSALGGVIAGVMTIYGGPAIIEMLGDWGVNNPQQTTFIVALATATATWAGIKYGGRSASYNVLDAPNVAMAPVGSPTAVNIKP